MHTSNTWPVEQSSSNKASCQHDLRAVARFPPHLLPKEPSPIILLTASCLGESAVATTLKTRIRPFPPRTGAGILALWPIDIRRIVLNPAKVSCIKSSPLWILRYISINFMYWQGMFCGVTAHRFRYYFYPSWWKCEQQCPVFWMIFNYIS